MTEISHKKAAMADSSGARMLFASYHCIADTASGAAIATRDLLELLTDRGWKCRALCGPVRDRSVGKSLSDALVEEGTPLAAQDFSTQPPFSMMHYRQGPIPISIYAPRTLNANSPPPSQEAVFLQLFDELLTRDRPDLLQAFVRRPRPKLAQLLPHPTCQGALA